MKILGFGVGLTFWGLLYFGVGALAHSFIVGPEFRWDMLSLGVLLGWPLLAILAGAALACAAVAMILALEVYDGWRSRRRARRAAIQRNAPRGAARSSTPSPDLLRRIEERKP